MLAGHVVMAHLQDYAVAVHSLLPSLSHSLLLLKAG